MGTTLNLVSTNPGRPESLNCWRGENPLPSLFFPLTLSLSHLLNPTKINVNKKFIHSKMNKRPLPTDNDPSTPNSPQDNSNEGNNDNNNANNNDKSKDKGKTVVNKSTKKVKQSTPPN